MNILKFEQYDLQNSMSDDFINFLTQDSIIESKIDILEYKEILKKTISDLKLNLSFVGTFATGIALMSPIVNNLVKNSKLNIEANPQNIVLLTVTAFSIIYLEERKNRTIRNFIKESEFKKEIKSLLEELKLRGMGDGIVKLVISCFKSILNISRLILENIGNVVSGFLDLFAYTSLFIPIINAILSLISKYDLNINTLPGNFLSLGAGVTTLIAKNGIKFILDKITNKLKIKSDKIMKYLNVAPYKKYPHIDIADSEDSEHGLINEEI